MLSKSTFALKSLVLALVLGMGGTVAVADMLPQPTGQVILTVSGQIAYTNGPGVARLDHEMLTAMGPARIDTSTVWTEGVQQFEGVMLAAVLAALGAEGQSVRLTALNDYAVTIPLVEIAPDAPLLALGINGADLSPRDKGPIWLIYPFDLIDDSQNDLIHARFVWQLNHIEVLP